MAMRDAILINFLIISNHLMADGVALRVGASVTGSFKC